ncbi:MAG: undecaprenyl-diphosphate phosphatase [Rhodospirillales bacterium]|nr:undecaprenyl-diphosphate phosphatase [Rhodospirillales bacterium]
MRVDVSSLLVGSLPPGQTNSALRPPALARVSSILSWRFSVDLISYATAALLGIVEGLTEFIPVSSTGHLILLVDLLGFRGPAGHVFEIAIQFGAILAICWLYRSKFIHVASGLFSDPTAQRFTLNLFMGFLPAMVIGAFAHDFIKGVLFNPWVVATMLVVGGFAILAIERWHSKTDVRQIDAITPMLALKIGFCQCVAMIPGVSRSGATIMGALLLGVGRATATEFSFFLAVPTMLAATLYDIYKNWSVLTFGDFPIIALGFGCAFIAALIVVRTLISFVSRNGFAPFAFYRIVLGAGMLAILSMR